MSKHSLNLSRFRQAKIALPFCLLIFFSMPLGATVYVMMEDDVLVDQSPIIAEIEILNALESRKSMPPVTEYLGVILNTFKGDLDQSSVIIQVPGGEAPDGWRLHLMGVPRFSSGEKVLLFLRPNEDGTYGVVQWLLGTFRIIWMQNEPYASRFMRQSLVLSPDGQERLRSVRDYTAFSQWISDRAQGDYREPDYFKTISENPLIKSFTLHKAKIGGRHRNIRWFQFDGGGTVAWRFRNADSHGSLAALQPALDAWNADIQTPIRFTYAGSTSNRVGLKSHDSVNTIIFGDPNNNKKKLPGTFNCLNSGVLAYGQSWSYGPKRKFNRKKYWVIKEGDIVFNNGAKCFLSGNPLGAAEVFAHELGHTLGIDHSCTPNQGDCTTSLNAALMRAVFHNDGRGASLKADDVAALWKLYSKFSPPSETKAWATSSTQGQISWLDNTSTETRFDIRLKIGSSRWRKWKEANPNKTNRFLVNGKVIPETTTFGFTNAKPGQTYRFRVRAFRRLTEEDFEGSKEKTVWSNTARVTMPGGGLAAPSNMQARSTSSTEGQLTWKDNSNNEDEFEIYIKIEDGSWQTWSTVAANTTSRRFFNATPGTTYRFKVRAKNSSETSKWSNKARVTMPKDSGGLTAPSNMQAWATSSTEGQLSWRDNSTNEDEFEIFIKIGSGTWSSWGSAAANRTTTGFSGATPGTTYKFKVRAIRGGSKSSFSNVATVTMPTGGGGNCNQTGCQSGSSCCSQSGVCCPSSLPHYCANTNLCYQFFTDAQAACGLSYEICGS